MSQVGTGYLDAEIQYDDDGEEIEDLLLGDGYGIYGCDEGEMVGAIADIVKHDERQAERQKAKDNYPVMKQ